jgi:hypothetical protein
MTNRAPTTPTGGVTTLGVVQGITNIMQNNSAANRYNRAVKSREAIESELARTGATTTTQSFANVIIGTVAMKSMYEGRLAVFACSVATGMCSERERRVTNQSAQKVSILSVGDVGGGDSMIDNSALTKKTAFGFSGEVLGDYLNTTMQELPLAGLPKYMNFANLDVRKRLESQIGPNDAETQKINAQLRAIGKDYQAQSIEYSDTFSLIELAFEAEAQSRADAAEQERKNSLQSLDQ